MDNLTLITCSYNTPFITLTMLRSFVSVHNTSDYGQQLVLIDNSTDQDTRSLLYDNKVPYKCSPGNTHGQGINKALELCKTDYALLVDTDIIFLKNHSDIFEKFKNMDLAVMGKIEGSRGGKNIYNRINPWHCFINVKKIKELNIKYFEEERMKASFETNKIYDIGSTFFEHIKNNNLKIGNVDLENNYYLHFEGMSWYKNKYNPSEEDTGIDFGGTHNNLAFVYAHEQKIKQFNILKNKFDKIKIQNKFYYK